MKNKAIKKIIFESVYRHAVIFISGCELKEANSYLKRYGIGLSKEQLEGANGVTASFTDLDSKKIEGIVYVVWVKSRKDFYTLLHETVHLCLNIFEDSNMRISNETTASEAFAFYQEFWFKKLWRLMNK